MLTEIRAEQSSLLSQEQNTSQILRNQGNSSFAAAAQRDQISLSQEAKEEHSRRQTPISQPGQVTEDFVSVNAKRPASESETSISWVHGTYHAGRAPKAPTGAANFVASGTAGLPLADEQKKSYAALSYRRMSRQGVMPTALAPSGTGISLRV